ncbi:allene oxide synthase, chloroplastic-like isoform X2 [Acropora millepora]|uniref:allene oxide synthase, chloroplastic-like isoform X2 n=1 Tax=Acropora millepora TaxID=45264 RepID=UPI001CF37966|nr:allene oxide synthase, chloroplastic-like isoform X2 [Acropora millepora]
MQIRFTNRCCNELIHLIKRDSSGKDLVCPIEWQKTTVSKAMQVSPIHDEDKEVPGQDKWTFFHVAELFMKGHGYFYKRRRKYKSSVFKVNMGVKGIHVCDKKAMKVFFDTSKIYKEPAFGRLHYNICLLDGYTPSMFSNGIPHQKQKAFLVQICKIAQRSKIFDTSLKLIKEYSRNWEKADSQLKATWELSIMDLISDIFTEAFLGTRLDQKYMYNFLKGSWGKGRVLKKAMEAASCLKQTLQETKGSSDVIEILKMAVNAGITEDQALMDILFMLNFNAYGGVSGVLRTCLARLYVLEEDYKQRMKNELKTILSNKELSEASLEEMILLRNFILEVLRMHPPVPVFFGRARDDFSLETECGTFIVRKDQLLVGNVHMAHRDSSIFDQPDKFMLSRFEDESIIDHIIYGYGPFHQEATPQNHRCPGQDIMLQILKVCLSFILLNCEYALSDAPKWTGKRLRRIGCPDKPIKLSYFKTKNQEVEEM